MDGDAQDWGVVGHEWAVRLLQRAVAAGSLSHAYLITGASGVGKSTLARALATTLLCVGGAVRPCGACRGCRRVTSGSHPDLHIVESGEPGSSLKVEQIRDFQRQLSLTPAESSQRVAILQRFDEATVGAQNALLKTLEEPPPRVLLIVLAIDADNLLPTIVSRCQHIPLRPLPVGQARIALVHRWHADADRAELLAHLSGGRLGWAVGALGDAAGLARRAQHLDALDWLLRSSVTARFKTAGELSTDAVKARELLDTWIGWWRDVLLLAAMADAPLTNVDHIESLRDHAAHFGVDESVKALRALRRTEDRIRANANLRLAFEVLMLDLPHR